MLIVAALSTLSSRLLDFYILGDMSIVKSLRSMARDLEQIAIPQSPSRN